MNYGIFMCPEGRSGSYPEAYGTKAEARAAINSRKRGALAPEEYEIHPLVDAKTRRNNQQRARRASPEAKAKEVTANRKSRFRAWCRENTCWEGVSVLNECLCEFCTRAQAAGFKPGDVPVPGA